MMQKLSSFLCHIIFDKTYFFSKMRKYLSADRFPLTDKEIEFYSRTPMHQGYVLNEENQDVVKKMKIHLNDNAVCSIDYLWKVYTAVNDDRSKDEFHKLIRPEEGRLVCKTSPLIGEDSNGDWWIVSVPRVLCSIIFFEKGKRVDMHIPRNVGILVQREMNNLPSVIFGLQFGYQRHSLKVHKYIGKIFLINKWTKTGDLVRELDISIQLVSRILFGKRDLRTDSRDIGYRYRNFGNQKYLRILAPNPIVGRPGLEYATVREIGEGGGAKIMYEESKKLAGIKLSDCVLFDERFCSVRFKDDEWLRIYAERLPIYLQKMGEVLATFFAAIASGATQWQISHTIMSFLGDDLSNKCEPSFQSCLAKAGWEMFGEDHLKWLNMKEVRPMLGYQLRQEKVRSLDKMKGADVIKRLVVAEEEIQTKENEIIRLRKQLESLNLRLDHLLR